jgi:ATP-dependent DNA ligase
VRAVLDGELVALDDDGKPEFPQLCYTVLIKRMRVSLTFMVFDVLSAEDRERDEPPVRRAAPRRILEDLGLNAFRWRTPEAFEDGAALWGAVCEHELEGVVAKRRSGCSLRASAAGQTENRLIAVRVGGRGGRCSVGASDNSCRRARRRHATF